VTDQTTQGGNSQQASGQSSTSTNSQSTSQGQQAQKDAAAQQQTDSGQQTQQQQAPQRPEWVPEKYWDPAKNELKATDLRKDYDSLSAFKAEQDIRKNSLPKDAAGYEVKLPAGFKPPEGMTFEFIKDDPGLKQAAEIAHARGLDQEAFSDMLGVYAANKISEATKVATARTAEIAKLGAAGPQRIDSIDTWLKARVGPKADVLIAQLKAYPVASMVETFEEVIRQFSNQGGAGFDQRGRQTQADQGKIPGYENMTFEQRRAAQMNQKANAASGGR
jgi:hypothetical protein